mgnify:CR=1 FL=1
MGLNLLKFLINPVINLKNYIEYVDFNKNMVNLTILFNKFKYHFLNRFMLLYIQTEKIFNYFEKFENMIHYVFNEVLEY